jgi:succinate dehydrogenase/fumarate reductase flavoprotein subunit
MWGKAGIIRDGNMLREALVEIEGIRDLSQSASRSNATELKRHEELQNMLVISEAICRAALQRTESRGTHYRRDFPDEDNENWLKNITVRRDNRQMILESVPVNLDMVLPEKH